MARRRRSMAAAAIAALLLGTSAPLAGAEEDTTAPVGTITIGDGSGYASSLTMIVHVPATDDVGVTEMRIVWGGTNEQVLPYAPSFELTVPYPEMWGVSVTWYDAAGNASTTLGAHVIVDTTPPFLHSFFFEWDEDPIDDSMRVALRNLGDDRTRVTEARFRTGNGAWSPSYPVPQGQNPALIDWPYLDPAAGGSPVIGPREMSVQLRNEAGLWSTPKTQVVNIAYEADLGFTVTGDARTGHVVTFTPNIPAGAILPGSTVCRWTLFWGNDQSLYYGERDDTFGGMEIEGPKSKGYCSPWSVTIPWVPYRRFLVNYEAYASKGTIVTAWMGSSPEDEAFTPGVDSTSRHITSSSIPLVYVLPDVYQLVVGVPATYRAYTVAGETLRSTDVWSVQYIDVPERKLGGSTFTFTPKIAGHITVCWQGGASRTYGITACFDPPARYRDTTAPNTSTPQVGFGAGFSQLSVPLTVTWSGTDKGWGIGSYRLERSVNGGSWAKVTLSSATARSFTERRSYDVPVRYRVRATDKAGNTGSWDYSATVRPTRIADTSTSLVYSAGWTTVVDPTAYGGVTHESSEGERRVTLRFSGRSIAWLGEAGPTFGKARVYVDGVLAWVETGAAVDSPRQLLFRKTWSSVGTHTITVVNHGTASRPTISVDGFAILR